VIDLDQPDGTLAGWALILARHAHDETQAELARQLGVAERTVRRWECGQSCPLPAFQRWLRSYVQDANRARADGRGA
jgi:DNA-binding transcriptional regulator YiaG